MTDWEARYYTRHDLTIDVSVCMQVAQLGGRSRAKGASIQIKSVNQADILPTEEWRAHANSLAPPQLVNAPNVSTLFATPDLISTWDATFMPPDRSKILITHVLSLSPSVFFFPAYGQ